MATTKDIAAALSVDEQTVRRYARDGIIPFSQTFGGHRRYDLDEVRAALALARPSRLKTLEPFAEESPRLGSSSESRSDLRRRLRRRGGIALASIADAQTATQQGERAPFVGVPGSTRCLYGHGAPAR